jgi:glycogen(starch) synthase
MAHPMKHVVVITYEYAPRIVGGLGIVATQLSRQLAGEMQITVVTVTDQSSVRMDEEASLSVVRFPKQEPYVSNKRMAAGPILRFLENKLPSPPDLIHVHSVQGVDLAVAMKQKWQAPLVYTSHSVTLEEIRHARRKQPGTTVFLQTKLYQAADKVIVPSPFDRNVILRHYPSLRSKVEVIPNGTDLVPEQPADRQRYRILYVGRLTESKGFLTLIDAMPRVVRAFPQSSLHVLGRGSHRFTQKVWSRIRTLRLQKHVVFHGWQPETKVQEQYRRATVLVVPSKYESFGLVPLEAVMFGLPVVCSTRCGILSCLEQDAVLTVPPGDPGKLSDQMMRVLQSPWKYRYEPALQTDLKAKCDWKTVTRLYQNVFEETLAAFHPPASLAACPYSDWQRVRAYSAKKQGYVWVVQREMVDGSVQKGYFKFTLPHNQLYSGPMIANERVAALLAHRLGLPVHQTELAELEGNLGIISIVAPDACGTWANLPEPAFRDVHRFIEDPRTLVRLFVFDVWTCNTDRGTNQNLVLVKRKNADKYSFYLIDHNHALLDGPIKWKKHPPLDDYWRRVPLYYKPLKGTQRLILEHPEWVDETVEAIRQITDEEIVEIVESVSPVFLTQKETADMIGLLIGRRDRLDDLIRVWRRWASEHKA